MFVSCLFNPQVLFSFHYGKIFTCVPQAERQENIVNCEIFYILELDFSIWQVL